MVSAAAAADATPTSGTAMPRASRAVPTARNAGAMASDDVGPSARAWRTAVAARMAAPIRPRTVPATGWEAVQATAQGMPRTATTGARGRRATRSTAVTATRAMPVARPDAVAHSTATTAETARATVAGAQPDPRTRESTRGRGVPR